MKMQMLMRILSPTNRKLRLVVGLMLVALVCVQCTQSTNPLKQISNVAVAKPVDGSADQEKIEQLAKTDHIALLQYCLDNYHKHYKDYTCTFSKQERLDGQVGKEQVTHVKFKEAPFSVAMAWIENPPMGDRVLYVEGKFGNEMLVRPTSPFLRKLAPTVSKKPDGPEARKASLRTVNQFGFERSLAGIIEVYQQAKARGELKQEFGGYCQVEKHNALKLIRLLPPGNDYPAAKTITYIDTKTLLPIMVEGFGWDNDEFICRYLFSDIKLNCGLTDEDFAPEMNDLVTPK